MTNETITFYCPACGIKLTVPASLAGVVGPCPSCGMQIHAPDTSTPEPAAVPEPVKETTHLKPEPRQLPQRTSGIEVPARQMPEPMSTREFKRRVTPYPLTQDPYVRNLIRLLVLGVFLLASGAFMYGVLKFLKRQPPMDPAHRIVEPFSFRKPIDEQPPADGADDAAKPTEAAPGNSADPADEGAEPNSSWKDAEAVLEKFLAANSLAERLPLIETQTPEEELAASCLAGPLPAAKRIVPEFRETNPVEKIIDSYYTVEFQTGDLGGQSQTILMRSRGNSPPKVVADPFLDTFGGRLATYAAGPAEKGGVFQVVVYAVASCTNPKIPNREKKLTLKLLASDNEKEIARAYFGKQSKISEMLEDDTYGLSYGDTKACTVLLRWNTEDNPDYPYLEALAIKDLGWNP